MDRVRNKEQSVLRATWINSFIVRNSLVPSATLRANLTAIGAWCDMCVGYLVTRENAHRWLASWDKLMHSFCLLCKEKQMLLIVK